MNMSLAMAGLALAQGLGQMSSAKKTKKAQAGLMAVRKKGAEQKAAWNEKEIEKSFIENYSQVMYQYGQKISDIMEDGRQAHSEVTTQMVASAGDADLSGSSAFGTMKADVDKEVEESIRMMSENQRRAAESMVNERNQQSFQNQMGLADASMNMRIQEAQNEFEYQQQMASGIMSAIKGGIGVANFGSQKLADKGIISQESANTVKGIVGGDILTDLLYKPKKSKNVDYA